MAIDKDPPRLGAPDPPPKPGAGEKAGVAALVAVAIAGAVAVSAPFTAPREGLRTAPYWDPAHIRTVCYGETERAMRNYSPAECLALLGDRQAGDYAPPLVACVPGFADPAHRLAFAAAIDAAYNAGTAAFCRSRMARAFVAGQWRTGCDLFAGWYATARIAGKSVPLKGLIRRRDAERDLCLKGEA